MRWSITPSALPSGTCVISAVVGIGTTFKIFSFNAAFRGAVLYVFSNHSATCSCSDGAAGSMRSLVVQISSSFRTTFFISLETCTMTTAHSPVARMAGRGVRGGLGF